MKEAALLLCFVFAVLWFAGLRGGSSSAQKELDFVNDVSRELLYFAAYCEKHRATLPPNILERFEEMEKNLERINDARGKRKGIE